MKDILNKAIAANDNADAVAGVINTIVNTPCQDTQPKTNERSPAVEEALVKRYKALRCDIADIIANVVYGNNSISEATDDIIKVVTNGRIIEIKGANNNSDELY